MKTGLPQNFQKPTAFRWSAPLPGPSAAAERVGQARFRELDRIAAHNLHALCLERATGKVLWNHDIASAFSQDA